jgi:hypothetical protein
VPLVPLSPSPGTEAAGQEEGASSDRLPVLGRRRFILAQPSGAAMDRHARSWCEIPLPLGFIPLLAQPLPEVSQWLRMGPRNQTRRVPAHCPKGWKSGQALHPTRLRLVRQVSLDCRVASVPPGPVHHRGWRGGLGWQGREVQLRPPTFRWPQRREPLHNTERAHRYRAHRCERRVGRTYPVERDRALAAAVVAACRNGAFRSGY